MPVNFSGKWKVKSADDNVDVVMAKEGYSAEVIKYMKTSLSFETRHNGEEFTHVYTDPDGKAVVVEGKIGTKEVQKDNLGREVASITNWEGDKLVTEGAYVDAPMSKIRIVRELKGNLMLNSTTLMDSGVTAETIFEKC
ncbi:uncharacterized protein LOC135483641 [Lineus longissimus]|uniref:uncharacterized protein LOC135483641 n=1 Tax=Lineus longissimus TaxID=88925 RepID=UPI002B4DD8B9